MRLIISALLLTAWCAASPLPEQVLLPSDCTVTDGDTIRCGEERIRLLAIDAAEQLGSCRPGRTCAPGDPALATQSLKEAMGKDPLMIRRFANDRYGRTLALVSAGGIDLSCHQLESGHAIYVERWDNDGAVARTCAAVSEFVPVHK